MRDGTAPPSDPAAPREILRVPAFAYFWSGSTLQAAGAAISGVAVQVLIVTVLDATPAQISILSALSVLPYLFLGLIVGALMDRWRRQRTLVLTSIGRALVFGAVPVLLLTGTLTVWSLAAVILALGVLSLFADSAAQPLLPRLVPRRSLVAANARLSQSDTVAGTGGPALGGALVSAVGASFVLALTAVLAALAAILEARIRVDEPRAPQRAPGRHVGHDIAEGLRYTYRHRTLRPLAFSVHAWFLGHSLVTTVLAVYVLRELGLPAWAFGIALGAAGVGGFTGAMLAPRLGARWGAGRAILVARALEVLPWLLLAVAPLSAESGTGIVLAIVGGTQFVYGLGMGLEDANDVSYRQSVAPDSMQGRMNATIRTVNRVVFFFGALFAGLLMTQLGYRWTIGLAAAVFAIAALIVVLSPLRSARHDDE